MNILQNTGRLTNYLTKLVKRNTLQNECYQSKQIWGYVAIAFNKVDTDRLKLVGADRLCTEWLLKNGGAVRILEFPNKLLRDYNTLPPESTKFHISVVDASNSSIMKIGLEHFHNCKHIEKVIFHNCNHLEEDSLIGLIHLKNTLKELQISSCSNISDAGFDVIGDLSNLKKLTIFDMMYVKNMSAVAQKIQQKLPACNIDAK